GGRAVARAGPRVSVGRRPATARRAGGPPAGPGAARPGGEARPPAEPGQYKDVVPPLVDALADADGGVRQSAAAALVKIGPDATQPLIDALTAKQQETRANAAYGLGHLNPPGPH